MTINISVKLYGVLRDKLPRENKGRTSFAVAKGTTVREVLDRLDLPGTYMVALNQGSEVDHSIVVSEGDEIRVFPPVGGG